MNAITPLLMVSALLATPQARPRLFCDAADLQAFCKRIEQEGPFARAWEHIRARADELLKVDFVAEAEAGKGSAPSSNPRIWNRQLVNMGHSLGFVWAVTGEARYAEKLREALLFYPCYTPWVEQERLDRDPPWRSDLSTARMLRSYAVGYDFLREFLSPAERRTITEAMVRCGLRPTLEDWLGPEGRVHALDSMGHNWWSVCVGSAGIAALAIENDLPEARSWADRVADAYPEWFAYPGNVLQNRMRTFDRTGGFYESVGYADYALQHFYLFRAAYRRARPARAARLDSIPELRGIQEFFLHTTYPTDEGMLTVNFGDQKFDRTVSGVVILSAAQDADDRLASAMRWYFARTGGEPRSIHEIFLMDPSAPAALPADLPLARLWPDMGWAVLRDSWKPNATLLAVKCGHTWGHAHADAGSFILWSAGAPILIDSGTCNYGRREYHEYYLQARAHNVVLLDGQGQPPEDIYRGSKTPGRIPVLLDAGVDSLRLVLADATGPTAPLYSRNYRTLLWAGGVILVIDELRSHREGHFEWLLHSAAQARVDEAAARIALRAGSAGARVETIWPEQVRYHYREGLHDGKPDKKVAYLAVVTPETAREAKFVTAVMPCLEPSEAGPKFERLSGPHFLGTAWREGDLRTEVYLNLRADGRRMHVNSNAEIGPWQTDAYLLVIQREGQSAAGGSEGIVRFAVLSGSYLRDRERVELDSLRKVHAIWEPAPEPGRLTIAGADGCRIRLRSPIRPKTLMVNDRGVPPVRYDESGKMVEIIPRRP